MGFCTKETKGFGCQHRTSDNKCMKPENECHFSKQLSELEQWANQLYIVQKDKCMGEGVSCVQTMISFLKRGRFDLAQNTRIIEHDKTRVFDDLEEKLFEIFGCQYHGLKNCPICLPVSEPKKEIIKLTFEEKIKKLCDDKVCCSMAKARRIVQNGKFEKFIKGK